MARLSISICFFLWSLAVTAQDIEHNRRLSINDQPQPVEQAFATLVATNRIREYVQVEYKAGQSILLQPGFDAKSGAVFVAHIGNVSASLETMHFTLATYPNPFDDVTTITYVLTRPGRASLQISDVEGRLISKLVDQPYQEAGRYSVEWKGNGVPAGTYVCTLEAGPRRIAKRIVRK